MCHPSKLRSGHSSQIGRFCVQIGTNPNCPRTRINTRFLASDPALNRTVVTTDNGEVATLYCMAYDAPHATTKKARSEFWNYGGLVELHIGARSAEAGEAFRNWIEEELAKGTSL
jgi:hypothetical protein